jgi:ferredoxin-like protein FixX
MPGIAIITEACIGVKDRACVDVCPVQCIYEFRPSDNVLASEQQAGMQCRYSETVCCT